MNLSTMDQECWGEFKARIAKKRVLTNNPVLLLEDEFVQEQKKIQEQEHARLTNRLSLLRSLRRRPTAQFGASPSDADSKLTPRASVSIGTTPRLQQVSLAASKGSWLQTSFRSCSSSSSEPDNEVLAPAGTIPRMQRFSLATSKGSWLQTSFRSCSSTASGSDNEMALDCCDEVNLIHIVRRGSDPLVGLVGTQYEQPSKRNSISFNDLTKQGCSDFSPSSRKEESAFSHGTMNPTLEEVSEASSGVINAPYDLS